MDAEIGALLPWVAMLVLAIADIVRHMTHILQGHERRRRGLAVAALLCLAAGWSLVIVSAGPAPVVPRLAMLAYIRWCVLGGAVLMLGVNAVDAVLAVRRYEARRNLT